MHFTQFVHNLEICTMNKSHMFVYRESKRSLVMSLKNFVLPKTIIENKI